MVLYVLHIFEHHLSDVLDAFGECPYFTQYDSITLGLVEHGDAHYGLNKNS